MTGDVIVFIDADGSHDANDIPALVKPIVEDRADLVVASRMTGGSDELHSTIGEAIRLFGSTLINLAINYRLNVRITDAQNGFRAIRTTTAAALDLEEDGTTIEQEMLIKTIRKGFRNDEVPGHEYRRVYGSSSISVRRTGPRYVYSCMNRYLPYHRDRTLLDVGCAHGFMLEAASQLGYVSSGLEISPAGDIARERGFHVVGSNLEDRPFPPESFDVVTMIDVIEHLTDPLEALRCVYAMLKPEGIVFLVTPDIGSLSARIMRSAWPHYLPEHLIYYSPTSMHTLLDRTFDFSDTRLRV